MYRVEKKVFYNPRLDEIGIGREFGDTIWFHLLSHIVYGMYAVVSVQRNDDWIMIGDFE